MFAIIALCVIVGSFLGHNVYKILNNAGVVDAGHY
jgi:hypothetical protein